jgi:hypothetical protein
MESRHSGEKPPDEANAQEDESFDDARAERDQSATRGGDNGAPGADAVEWWLARGTIRMNMRRKHEKLPDYVVQFVGHSARIFARRGNAEHACLDFVSGAAILIANEGHLLAPKRAALSSAVADLPSYLVELKSLVKSVSADSAGHRVLRRGEVEIHLNQGADVERFVRQAARRYRAIEPILEQAEEVGSRIERASYDDYIDEIAKTGIARVVSYGAAFFVDGKLTYYPERRTVLIKS